jgi:hypothetical protein
MSQSSWIRANFGCPISSPNPCLPLSLQLTNRTHPTIGTINNDPILDCKQFWDLNDIREHEGEPKLGDITQKPLGAHRVSYGTIKVNWLKNKSAQPFRLNSGTFFRLFPKWDIQPTATSTFGVVSFTCNVNHDT